MQPTTSKHISRALRVLVLGISLITAGQLLAFTTTLPLDESTLVSTSNNWAGYVALDGTYTGVTGSWIVPAVSPDPEAAVSADATWVGIGGVERDDLIQIGTLAKTNASGDMSYRAWIETLPEAAQEIPLTVRSGDSITASLTYQGNDRWLMMMKNNTTGKTYRTTVTYESSASSAEWIQERALNGATYELVPLDYFGTVTFTQASAIKDGKRVSIAESGARAVSMVDEVHGNQIIAEPTALAQNGSSFSVTRLIPSPIPAHTAPREIIITLPESVVSFFRSQ